MTWTRNMDASTSTRSLLLLCQIALLGIAEATSNIFASGCTGQQVQLSCPHNHKIAIKRVFYGVKKGWDCQIDTTGYRSAGYSGARDIAVKVNTSDCCRASHTDCQVDGDSMYPTLNIKCSGYPSCELEVQKVMTIGLCRYRSYTDYMTIVYDCISTADIVMFCSDDVKRGKTLYLANKEYPAAIRPRPEGDECQCSIRTSHPQGIGIHTIDVLLAWAELGPMDCRRYLKIQDPMTYQRDIQCAHRGYYGFKSIYSRPVSNVTVTLSSLPGDGMAFVWLQAKPNDADGTVEIFCGQPLQDLLKRIRLQSEARQREDTTQEENGEDDKKSQAAKTEDDAGRSSNATRATSTAGSHTLSSDLAAVVGGIVASGFALIAGVIIAMACRHKRVHKEKRQHEALEMQPTVSSQLLDLTSYCRYDYDDDHLCSINRSPMKMALLADEGAMAKSFRPNGFTTIAHAGECQIHRETTPSPPLPPGISTPPPSAQNQPLLPGRSYREVHYPGDMSLRFVKPLVNSSKSFSAMDMPLSEHHHPQRHTTLPANRKTVLITCGPKSPLGKRSKSVTFSQPVAMVTPLNSESEESMEKSRVSEDLHDLSYDNLSKLDIPDYSIPPEKAEHINIPQWDKEYREDSQVRPRPMSSFNNTTDQTDLLINPPPDFKLNSDPDDLAFVTDRSSQFWNPARLNVKPLILPKSQKADLYETGV